MRPLFRDLLFAASMQFVAFLFATLILDLGQFASATAYLSIAYWAGIILILSRRAKALTSGDRMFFRFGLIPILVIGIPIFLHVWEMKRAI